jgi:hypothetical protein
MFWYPVITSKTSHETSQENKGNMPLDYQQVQRQVREMGENASLWEQRRKKAREMAEALLESYATDLGPIRQKVLLAARQFDPNLRCALPVSEPINAGFTLPLLPAQATLMAADGSQIAPDRHAEVAYCLVNVGAIQMGLDKPEAPQLFVESQLMYDEQLLTEAGVMTDAALALARDVAERTILARLAVKAAGPVITFTDGPMELWGTKDSESSTDFQNKLSVYLESLTKLCELGAVTAGYVDKPAASLVVRMLEVMLTPENELPDLKKNRPLRGISDRDIYRSILGVGERSAVFEIQSKSARQYKEALGLHFFYLNVGKQDRPWLARVELPAWVVNDPEKLDHLQSVLVNQCEVMGSRPYPYLLHRAHEAALVTYEEKEQVTQMIVLELRRRGVEVGEISSKQYAKKLSGKTRYSG